MERRRGARTEARVAGNGDPRRPALQDDREEKDQAKGGVRVDRSRSPAPAREADTAQALGNQETRPGATPVDRGGNTTSFTRWVEGIRESQEGCGDRTSTVRSEHLSDGAAFPLRSGSVAHPRGWVDREGHGREGSGEGRATVRSAPFADRSLPDGASEPTRRPVRIHGENRLVSSRRPSGRGRSRRLREARCDRKEAPGGTSSEASNPDAGSPAAPSRRARLDSEGPATGREVGEGALGTRHGRRPQSPDCGIEGGGGANSRFRARRPTRIPVLENAARQTRELRIEAGGRWGDPPEGNGG